MDALIVTLNHKTYIPSALVNFGPGIMHSHSYYTIYVYLCNYDNVMVSTICSFLSIYYVLCYSSINPVYINYYSVILVEC